MDPFYEFTIQKDFYKLTIISGDLLSASKPIYLSHNSWPSWPDSKSFGAGLVPAPLQAANMKEYLENQRSRTWNVSSGPMLMVKRFFGSNLTPKLDTFHLPTSLHPVEICPNACQTSPLLPTWSTFKKSKQPAKQGEDSTLDTRIFVFRLPQMMQLPKWKGVFGPWNQTTAPGIGK